MSGKRFRCPECRESDNLWQEVTFEGWQEVDAYLKPTGTRDVETFNVLDEYQQGGCTCGWEGSFSALEALGIDDEPLPAIHPRQTQIEVAA